MSKQNKKNSYSKLAKRNKKARAAAKSRQQPRLSKRQQALQRDVHLAVQHHNAGELSKAKDLFQQVLEKDPRQPVALHSLGVIAHQVGNNDRALELISKVVAANPNYTAAHINLGAVQQELGRVEDAAASFRKALVLKPNHGIALNNLGNALRELGQLDEAVVCYHQAIAVEPNYAQAHSNLGLALHELRRLEESVTCHLKAVAIDPKFVDAYSHLGNTQQELGRMEDALANFQKALAIDPDHVKTHNFLGEFYEKTNLLDKAEFHTQKVLEINPHLHDAVIRQSVLLRRREKTQEATELLERLLLGKRRGELSSKAYFELGKLYDLARDSQRAFACFTEGNQLQVQSQCKGNDIKPEEYLKAIEHTENALTRESVDTWLPDTSSADVDSPVFLIGFPRSGTTLLDQILDSHPRLQVMEEKPALDQPVSTLRNQTEGFPDALASLQESDIQGLRKQYFQSVQKYIDRLPSTMLVDKFPLNTRYIPMIMRLFPSSRIILALRHPCDVVLSNFMQSYKINSAMAHFHTLEDSARLYHQVMGLWLQCEKLFSINVHTVKYENLVEDLEGEARRLLQFLDVDWTDAVLDYHKHAQQRGKINTPSYEQVSQPIYQRAKYRWRRYEEQLKPVLKQLEPYIEAFGYEAAPSPTSNHDN